MPPRRKPKIDFILGWIKEYPEIAQTEDGTALFCSRCQVKIGLKKHAVQRHVNSDRHLAFHLQRRDFKMELTKFMVGCNIPWSQLNNPIFSNFIEMCLQKQFPENTMVPSESLLRQQYLRDNFNDKVQQVKNELKDSYVYVILKETSEAVTLPKKQPGTSTANVIMGRLRKGRGGRPHLIASKTLQHITGLTIADVVKQSANELWGADHTNHGKVLLLVTDTAPIMTEVAWNLQGVFPNMMHLTCLANTLNLVADQIRAQHSIIDEIISSVKEVFSNSPNRINFFKQTLPNSPLPPQPAVVTWSTWFESAVFYEKHLHEVRRVVDSMDTSEGQEVVKAKTTLNKFGLKNLLTNIVNNYACLQNTVVLLKSQSVSLQEILKSITNLQISLSRLISDENGWYVSSKLTAVLDENYGFDTLKKMGTLMSGGEIQLTEKNRRSTLDYFKYFSHAPTTIAAADRSFSSLNWLLTERRRGLTSDNIERLLIVHYENYDTPTKPSTSKKSTIKRNTSENVKKEQSSTSRKVENMSTLRNLIDKKVEKGPKTVTVQSVGQPTVYVIKKEYQ